LASGTELKIAPGDTPKTESKPVSVSNPLASLAAAKFASQHWRRLLALSALVLVPCFWHRHIIASDLGSHLYNAWITQLIHRGQVPGLWLSHQWTNVLFDWMLSGFGSLFGLFAAEKIAVSLCVLVFFWGAFALVGAASGRAPWLLTPLIGIFAYGWSFHIGLYNYYLSIGLSFFCLAIFWRGKPWERIAILPAAVLIAIAHPFGVLWLAGACIFIGAMLYVPPKYHALTLLVSAVAIWSIRHYMNHHFVTEFEPDPWYMFSGLDQVILFGLRYRIIKWALLLFALAALAIDVIRRRRERPFRRDYLVPVQLYVVVELAVFLFPRGVTFPDRVPIALITERLTSISAIVLCCVLGVMRPSRWHLAASLAIAGIFAAFVYEDTAVANRIELQAERLVHTVPPGTRVIASILPLEDSRIMIQHTIDLACIGYCFSYGNYEPGSEVFRVRGTPGNPYVIPDYGTVADIEKGNYVVQPQDLPVYQVYQCTKTGVDLCIRPLAAGEQNNRLGAYRP